MTVKTLLKETLDSHLESKKEWLGQLISPKVGGSNVDYSAPGFSEEPWTVYVAPGNGWMGVVIQSGNAAVWIVEVIVEDQISKGACSNGYGAVWARVRKGQTVSVHAGANTTDKTGCIVRFVPDMSAAT